MYFMNQKKRDSELFYSYFPNPTYEYALKQTLPIQHNDMVIAE